MRIVSVNHAAVTSLAMGGEVSMHRQMAALAAFGHEVTVLAERGVQEEHWYEGVRILPLGEIGHQLRELEAQAVIGFHEQAIPAARAGVGCEILTLTRLDAPPRYAKHLLEAVLVSDGVIYNTHVASRLWGEPSGMVVHPPLPQPPARPRTSAPGDPYLLTSNLVNKGAEVTLQLAGRMPHQPFVIVRSPAVATHGLDGFEERAAGLPNVTVIDRVPPHEMARLYEACRIVLVPSRYETYGMAGAEGLGHGRPCVHVNTDHAAEGVGRDFLLDGPPTVEALVQRIEAIEADYEAWSRKALVRSRELMDRQEKELDRLCRGLPLWRRLSHGERTERKTRIRRRVR